MKTKSKETIIEEIEEYVRQPFWKWVFGGYNNWYIGVTQFVESNQQRHGYPPSQQYWRANSDLIARDIERYFQAQGMHGAGGGGTYTDHVYVFRISEK